MECESQMTVIKTEPIEDGYGTTTHLQNDQSRDHHKACIQNGLSVQEAEHAGSSVAGRDVQEITSVGNTNFSCLLCDVVCENREDLIIHLKNEHTSKNNFFNQGLAKQANFYMPYTHFRYSCNICGAKFKTFKNYFSHSMSHKGYENSSLNDVMFRSGKEVLQNYIDAEEGLPGTFKCDECKTVFVQRDSYAMHMMMRAMNETCRLNMPNDVDSMSKTEQTNNGNISPGNNQTENISHESKLLDSDVTESSSSESQKCLEDVTTKVDQDEYLKSVLDRVITQNGTQEFRPDFKFQDGGKPCIFCAQPFPDQDSLAMHVMSVHADQMLVVNPNRNNLAPKHRDNIRWTNPYMYPLGCKICGKKFVSRDNLAMHVLTHAQEEAAAESARERNMHEWKRKADQLTISSEEASTYNTKYARTIGNFNNFVHNKNILSASDLYCTSCSIQFYSKGDFEWHLRCRHNSSESKTSEPLCLTKSETRQADESSKQDSSQTENTHLKPLRRNSFSVDENSRHHYITPKRPISVDTCSVSKGTTYTRAEPDLISPRKQSPETKELRSHDLKIKKEIQGSMAIACVDALSSNEKRIIYSVFGSDLIKNEDTAECETKQKPTSQPSLTPQHSPMSRDALIPKTSPKSAADLKENLHEALRGKDAAMCRFCEIIFLNKAVYYLHMGLHNVNNRWQCNVCGKICKNSVDFAAHIIHR